ncbi:MAG: DNA adenine methylase [Synergistaceae bacterium]|jgi:adenine-specific DNA-methyltransferase|nr:DNA adenine methylase [Synergistaceae bacterium]
MNYIGSKYSLLPFLEQTIADVVACSASGGVFADLFAGTGAVAGTFKRKGYRVIANDIQHYAYTLNRHYVENVPPIAAERLDWLNSLDGEDGFVYNNYCAGSGSGRNYFTDENGRKCDAIRSALNRLFDGGEIGEDEYYYYLAGLINSIDKVANTASVYGAYLKHVKASAAKPLALELPPLVDGERGKAFCADISEVIRKVRGDVLYLDPPYNARQYCSNYHVLETISRYDIPTLNGVTGLRDSEADGQKSAFCSKRTVAAVFEDVMANADFKYIFLSYNNEGLMSLDTIRDIMERHGKYEQFTQGYHRFRADKEDARNHKADSTVEYLHVCVR